MNKITIWRHKEHKNIYLLKNGNYCGGGPDTPFYEATERFDKAVENAIYYGKTFDQWMNSFCDDDGKTILKAKITLTKKMEFDGYEGILKKEVVYRVADFEPITLVEPE